MLTFAVDIPMLFLTHGVLRIWLPAATTIAYAVAFAFNFVLNRVWAFGSTAPIKSQATWYVVICVANYVATVVIVSGLVALGMEYLIAKTLSGAVIGAANYVVFRVWVFR
jgi:putative flippase GtrA